MIKNKTDDELIDTINKAINELVFPKYTLKKAYNYYIEGMKGKINKADYWDMVDTVKSWTRLHKGEELTLKGIMSRTTENKREKMFLNAGVTLQEAAKEIGAKATDILNENNLLSSRYVFIKEK